jgi:topoisomerase-4 subunit B
MLEKSRRLVRLTIEDEYETNELMDKLMAKKRYTDRRDWLQEKGNLAEIQ